MRGSALVAIASVVASFGLAVVAFIGLLGVEPGHRSIERVLFPWIAVGGLTSQVGFLLDPLSSVMGLVVTGVGSLIHIYSRGYMERDPGAWRYFSYLNLFMGSMLTLVFADNFLLLFLGWEGVGLCSYLLIGFWYERKSAADAGKKAFVVNRIGDFGFLLGMLLVFSAFGTFDFTEIRARAPEVLAAGGGLATLIGILLFVGAAGKSAQIPLYVWLPDAMEGPTPVSALIHAATMVTAGVYMIARASAIYVLAPAALIVVGIVGCVTAFYSATIGMAQTDIKRVLAYSTISQLGYMFLACGVGAFAAGIFHVMTHAFFKALLFLGAGAVIHALHDEQDIRNMGGLAAHIPTTYRTFLVACVAIAGIPPLAGFFSKDAILWETFASGNAWLYALGLITAGLTAFYMFRLLFLTFAGASRAKPEVLSHVHPPSRWMTAPLVVLAAFSIVGGLVGVPILPGGDRITPFLNESTAAPPAAHAPDAAATPGHDADPRGTEGSPAAHGEHPVSTELLLMALSVLAAFAGIFLAHRTYVRRPSAFAALRRSWLARVVSRKYFMDELNDLLWVRSTRRLAVFLWEGVDVIVIDGVVNGLGGAMRGFSTFVRAFQNGQAQAYYVSFVLGSAALLAYLILR
jgi:NADH-quinone oxidoreductase subunit L